MDNFYSCFYNFFAYNYHWWRQTLDYICDNITYHINSWSVIVCSTLESVIIIILLYWQFCSSSSAARIGGNGWFVPGIVGFLAGELLVLSGWLLLPPLLLWWLWWLLLLLLGCAIKASDSRTRWVIFLAHWYAILRAIRTVFANSEQYLEDTKEWRFYKQKVLITIYLYRQTYNR